MAVACLMAVAGGCSSPEGSSSTTHSSTPDVTDKMTALLGPIIEHEGGRFSGVEISRSTGTLWMTNSAGKETTQITFGPDTQLENVSSQPRHYRDRPSVDPKDFDLDDYLAKVSETSKSCGEGQYWSVSAEVISSTASIVTQRCGMTDQGSSFLNRQPIAPITNVWSLEGLTTIWNEMLTFAPKGYVRDIGIKNSNVTILFATEYPPHPLRSWLLPELGRPKATGSSRLRRPLYIQCLGCLDEQGEFECIHRRRNLGTSAGTRSGEEHSLR